MDKRIRIFGYVLMFVLVVSSLANANALSSFSSINQGARPTFQVSYAEQQRSTYWPTLDEGEDCKARTDLILNIAPFSCQPTTVPSQLLAEQNVPVFCQVDALQINPLIDIQKINNIRFTGQYPKEVVGAGFHPARAALTNRDMLIDGPLISNIGYVVIILRKTENEDNQPDFVNVNLTAQVSYESGYSMGVGMAEFKLEPITTEDWKKELINYAFWNGRYFVKLDYLDTNRADISIYRGDKKITTQSIKRGETTETVYVPGTYCQTGLKIRFNDVELQQESVTLDLISEDNRERFVGYVGSKFLNNKCSIRKIEGNSSEGGRNVSIQCGSNNHKLMIGGENSGGNGPTNADFNGSEAEFNEAIEAYKEVVENYPNERDADSFASDYYGEIALLRAIKLAEEYKQHATKAELVKELKERYPSGGHFMVEESFESGGSVSIMLDNRAWTIKLSEIKIPSEDDKPKAQFGFGGTNIILSKGEVHKVNGENKGQIVVTSIDSGSVRVNSNCKESELRNVRLEIGDARNTCGKVLVLKNIEAKEVASISIIPQTKGTETEANLSVGIGITKRDIELSPEKAEKKAEKLNETVEKFENINERLTSVVEKMKAACFAVSAALTVKNLVFGFTGESLARSQVMSGANGWTQRCADLVANGKYKTLDVCYAENSGEIDTAINERKEAIKTVNKEISEYEKEQNAGLFGTIDNSKLRDEYQKGLIEEYDDEKINDKKIKDLLEGSGASVSQLRELQTNLELRNSRDGFTKERAESELKRIGGELEKQGEDALETSQWATLGITPTSAQNSDAGPTRTADIKSKEDVKGAGKILKSSAKNVALIHVESDGLYLVGIGADEDIVEVKPVKVAGDKIESDVRVSALNKTEFTENVAGRIVAAKYNNPIQSSDGSAIVKYFETEPYKGLPALVPFDKVNGWYVQTRQTLPVFGGQRAYDTSGRPASFYLCNVGVDGRIDGIGTDECTMFNVNSATSYGTFPGLNEKETNALVQRAIKALDEASNQYGRKTVRIGTENYDVGKAADIPATQCQNFMSPSDCQLLFNVCDPVICPSSRCDFGGKIPVADVIQTGIVGGALLCLPNFKGFGGDVYIPVCLSGINAGIEGYLSILKGYQSCLTERATTGRMVGLCDEIYSINLCEFFWRQMAPMAKILLPRLVEFAYGQGSVTRGGGEYTTVQAAWQNAQNSINYMTQTYAVNSLKAFRFGGIEEIGTQFCRASASGSFPTSFDTIFQADSPTQFHAWFSSARYSDVTVPATSMYKVFYHIYAGKDQGVYYNVYLKNPPQFVSVNVPSTVRVDSGYIGMGEELQESKDFTAPEGYKELCVSINGRETCGFKSVSTSLAANVLKDSYVQGQSDKEKITSESDCISGGPSLGALFVSGNPQSAADAAISPELYNRGIVRICSNVNPGEGTNPLRYKDVGYCDFEGVKCWLDSNSVQDALSDQNAGQLNLSTITSLDVLTMAGLESQGKFRYTDSIAIVAAVEKEVDNLDPKNVGGVKKAMLEKIEGVSKRLVLNHHKARLALTKAKLLDKVARSFVPPEKVVAQVEEVKPAEEAASEENGDNLKSDKYSLSIDFNDFIKTAQDGSSSKNKILVNGKESKFYLQGSGGSNNEVNLEWRYEINSQDYLSLGLAEKEMDSPVVYSLNRGDEYETDLNYTKVMNGDFQIWRELNGLFLKENDGLYYSSS